MLQPILKVDLSARSLDQVKIPGGWRRDFIGGASLAARLLFETLTPELDPFSEEAPLLILNGPLTGTAGPSVGRFVVCGKSPATGLWAESNVGGFWGPELRRAGYDGIWITGRVAEPTYLAVTESGVEFRSAQHLWGQDTYQIQQSIQAEMGSKARILAIGPAGEAQIPFSLLLCDHGRVAGRTGLGAVMGAKNLKAIAVRGSLPVPVWQPEQYAPLRAQANRDLKQDPLTSVLRELGSAGAADYFDYLGEMPKKYFSAGQLTGSEQISGASVAEKMLTGVSACHACVIACGRVVDLGDGIKRKGPEYETLVGFGPNLGIVNPVVAARFGEFCDQYGIDVISASGTIGLAFYLYEQGVITKQETGGLALHWGDEKAVQQCLQMLVNQQGFGTLLAHGALKLAQHFNVESQAIQVNRLELAYHDPRGASGMALVYATSPRGGCHNQSDYFMVDIGNADEQLGLEFHDRHAGAEKAANVARHQDWRTLNNALVMCVFANVAPETVRSLYVAATGNELTLKELLTAGERAWNLKRMINIRLGISRINDRIPERLLQPLEDGGSQGYVIPFEDMLAAYYVARGWDNESGRPLPETLSRLGLDDLQSHDRKENVR